jgi:hypothetical protein
VRSLPLAPFSSPERQSPREAQGDEATMNFE